MTPHLVMRANWRRGESSQQASNSPYGSRTTKSAVLQPNTSLNGHHKAGIDQDFFSLYVLYHSRLCNLAFLSQGLLVERVILLVHAEVNGDNSEDNAKEETLLDERPALSLRTNLQRRVLGRLPRGKLGIPVEICSKHPKHQHARQGEQS